MKQPAFLIIFSTPFLEGKTHTHTHTRELIFSPSAQISLFSALLYFYLMFKLKDVFDHL